MDLITRRIITEEEGSDISREILDDYANPDSSRYDKMIERIRKQLGFTSLKFNRLDDMAEAIGIGADKLCLYCFNGKE